MFLQHPDIVRFDTHAWDDCALLALDRLPKRTVEDHSDLGPFPTFADVPEQSIHIRIQRTLRADDPADPPLGAAGTLTFYLSPAANELARKKVTIPATLTSIRHDLSPSRPATQTLTFTATSEDGADPVVVSDAAFGD